MEMRSTSGVTGLPEGMEGLGGLLEDLRLHMQRVAEGEMQRLMPRLKPISEEDRAEVEGLVRRLMSRMLHAPVSSLLEEVSEDRHPGLAPALCRLFGLDGGTPPHPETAGPFLHTSQR